MSRVSPLYRQVYDSLVNRMYNGDFPTGSELPSIPNLARMYGVSTITVRGAFHMLRENGYIEVVQGKAARVAFDSRISLSRTAYSQWMLRHKTAVLDINRFNALLAPAFIAFGMSLCDDQALRELQALAATAPSASTPCALIDHINTFVQRIVCCLRNPLALDLYRSVCDFIRVPLALTGECGTMRAHMQRDLPRFMQQVLALHRQQRFADLYRYAHHAFSHFADLCQGYIQKLDLDETAVADPISFQWVISQEYNYRYNAITNDLITRIACAEYKNGELLPSEAQLCRHYNASAVTVRHALAALGSLGITKTRNGRGTLVTFNGAGDVCAAGDPTPILHNMQQILEILQCVALTLPATLAEALPLIPSEAIATLRANIRRLYDNPHTQCSDSVVLLLHFILSHSPCQAQREVFCQFEARLCLNSHYRAHYAHQCPDYYATTRRRLLDTLKALQARDAQAAARGMYDQLHAMYQLGRRICAANNLGTDIPFPPYQAN